MLRKNNYVVVNIVFETMLQGCDASVLLDGSASGPSEQDAPPNLSLRAKSFEIIDDIHRQVHKRCGAIVSCADIIALTARDAIVLVHILILKYFQF